MHIGTARTAYHNWLAARSTGGRFILRIDDTNQHKIDPQYTQVIIDTMAWLKLDYDEIVYQSSRFPLYKTVAESLIEQGKAAVIDGATVLTQVELPESWHDEVAGDIKISADEKEKTQQVVLLRSDGSPTYHFASVVDDAQLGIDLVLRGHDHISNMARQIAIFNAIGSPIPKFAHIGLIFQNKKKLSKRDGAASMLFYREKGYDPDAMLNFLLRMGWGPFPDDKTTVLIDQDRAKELFRMSGFRNAPAGMDLEKLEAFDRKYKAKKGIWRNGAKLLSGDNN